ncbi:MAG: XrtN system VIT domain-containing protein [Bacteroidia bacterium]|nr:XrtN system VIT domain-containing protein [Bacteroidia bacterium]MCF8426370.1 XrtN system VIT domain-containing protein [Bacteroidia bacterium]MCF8447790.1 XrtN system VIT domain-containing protein [Bacteroidia bacterium]
MPKLNLGSFKLAYQLGWILLFISFAVFIVGNTINIKLDSLFLLFGINFFITIGYYVLLIITKFRQERPRPNIPYACWVHFILLYTISAFGLNQNIPVFAEFPTWLSVYTLLGASLFLIFPYFEFLPKGLKNAVWVLTGAELILSIYFTLYLLPLMPISILGFWFFGLTVHTFVPVFWVVLIVLLIQKQEKVNKLAIVLGAIIPLLVMGVYLNNWRVLKDKVSDIQAENNLNSKLALPAPIALAQWLPADKLSDEILISPFYSQRFWSDAWGLGFDNETKYHNPLAILGEMFFGAVNLDFESTTSLLNIRRNQRHKTEGRLWTGVSLTTNSVTSQIQVFPEYRIAYHQKILTIHNSPEKRNKDFWFVSQTQQALYTFHLPEGSIVTSLSLTIDGKEELSRLTTRKKADKAFKQIVGVERRDPALVHWKEGNQVVVSVFPCTAAEDRVFKIGFTTPLKYSDGKLWLENIWFEGPDAKHARELTEIRFAGEKGTIELSKDFEEDETGKFYRKGDYLPYWKFSIPSVPLSQGEFIFHKKAYSISEAKPEAHSVRLTKYYLDLNQNWTKEEYTDLLQTLHEKEVFVMASPCAKITPKNADAIWDKYSQCQFSLPYFQLFTSPESSMVICKGTPRSPLLKEMKESEYAKSLTHFFQKQNAPILFVNIGDDLSPLYKTLAELRLIKYLPMDLGALKNSVLQQRFSFVEEADDKVFLSESNLVLNRKDTSDILQADGAPDHLMRLFAYNNIVRKIGKNFFDSEQYEDELFLEAEEAYVLSPVTSMIVLESEEDYNRMGIDKNKNTLGNAEILEGGAVPEPQEWALIVFVALLLTGLFAKEKLKARA